MSTMLSTPKVNIKELKNTLRLQFRSRRETMSRRKKKLWDTSIAHNLFRLNEYQSCTTVFAYVSKDIEVSTAAILQRAWRDGKRVAVPLCVKGTYQMEFYYIQSERDLEKGTFGVMEPVPQRCEQVTDLTHGFCVVPGLGFDARGFRLGYGKGYYDRFLSNFQGFTVGICYTSCIQWNLPHGYYDRPVDVLVTENYIRRTDGTVQERRLPCANNARRG